MWVLKLTTDQLVYYQLFQKYLIFVDSCVDSEKGILHSILFQIYQSIWSFYQTHKQFM